MAEYKDWQGFDFKPQQEILIYPNKLIKNINVPSTILEVGCDKGNLCFELVQRGYDVLGVDLNSKAINVALEEKNKKQINNVDFICADLCEAQEWKKLGVNKFDAIVLIKVLTVIPRINQRKAILNNIISHLKDNGILYIYDFYLNKDNPAYSKRYDEGLKIFGEWGTFEVKNEQGNHMYYAHHHTEDEVKDLCKKFEVISLDYLETISYHGNRADTFEFVGRVKTLK